MNMKPFFLATSMVISMLGTELKTFLFSNDFFNSAVSHPKTVNLAIDCPPSLLTFYVDNDCEVDVSIPTPTSTCNITSMTYSVDGNPPTSLSAPFPSAINLGVRNPGSLSIEWQVEDDCLVSTSCSQTITVVDTIKPIIMCQDKTIYLTSVGGSMDFVPQDLLSSYSDNCGILSISSNIPTFVGCNDASVPTPTVFTITVTDIHNNVAMCNSNVFVFDTFPPTINCPSLVAVNTNPGLCSATNVIIGTASVDDGCLLGLTTPVPRYNGIIVGPTTVFPVGMNTVIWSAQDASGNIGTCETIVFVNDNELPTITCPPTQTLSVDAMCTAILPDYRALASTSDNCPVNITQTPAPGTVITSSTTVTLNVTDPSNNQNTCEFEVIIQDNTPPDLICRDTTIISISDYNELPASIFYTNVSDNCSSDVVVRVRRMLEACNDTLSDNFGPYINLCCEDVNDTLTIVLRATDEVGNFTECMVTLIVQDKRSPSIVHALPDISVSCEYPFDFTTTLPEFGTYRFYDSLRTNIVITDPGFEFYPPSGIAGIDGLVNDVCPGNISVSIRQNIGMCRTGTVNRDFDIEDQNGNLTTYTQTIHVVNTNLLRNEDIIWPTTAYVDNCSTVNIDTTLTGAPYIPGFKCAMAAATYMDLVFDHPTYCKNIRRTWTVIDWCQYQTNSTSSNGRWTFVQNIYITNSVLPTINPVTCRDTTICLPSNECNSTSITLTASGSDDCSLATLTWNYFIDIDNNNSNDLSGTGNSFTRNLPKGTHKVTWELRDGCSNISTCSSLVTIKECKAPTAIAKRGLATNLNGNPAYATIWASDFDNQSFDNCTPTNQLRFSFSSNINDTQITYSCDSLGSRNVQFWVTDANGNQAFTNTYVVIQDNHNLCPDNNTVFIAGKVYTEANVMINDVTVVLEGAEKQSAIATNKDGFYFFDKLHKFNDYIVKAARDEDIMEGISTLDLVLIQRHILGISPLDSPYKLIAADINKSNSISAADLTELRRVILGMNKSYSNNYSWRFVPKNFVFVDPTKPLAFDEEMFYQKIEGNMASSDWIGVKIGDVNNSIDNILEGKAESRVNNTIRLALESSTDNADNTTTIPFYTTTPTEIYGMQISIELSQDFKLTEVISGALNIEQNNYHIKKIDGVEYLLISFNNDSPKNYDSHTPLFYLKGSSTGNLTNSDLVKQSDKYLTSLVFGQDLIETKVLLTSMRKGTANTEEIKQNYPNPFAETTSIPITMSKAGAVEFTITDNSGQIVSSNSINLGVGAQELVLGKHNFNNQFGVFFINLKTPTQQTTIKVIRLE